MGLLDMLMNGAKNSASQSKWQLPDGDGAYKPVLKRNRPGGGEESVKWEDKRTGGGENAVLPSSAGWEKNDPSRRKVRFEPEAEKPLSIEAENYLRQQSESFGNTEFVGDLVDHLTSNRYYTTPTTDVPISGAPTDLGPTNVKWDNTFGSIDPAYGTLVTREAWNDDDIGGQYRGPTGWDDPALGLVKLGLYGGGNNTEKWEDDMLASGLADSSGGEVSDEAIREAMQRARLGDEDAINALSGLNSIDNNPVSSFFLDYLPGSMKAESPDWVGNFAPTPGLLSGGEDSVFGDYSAWTDEIRYDPNDRNSRETIVHELAHRGIDGLRRGDVKDLTQYVPGNWGLMSGQTLDDFKFYEDPMTGEGYNFSSLLGRRVGDDYGQSVEHNLIDSVSRNRNNRLLFESYGEPTINEFPRSRENAQDAYTNLGTLATNMVNAAQKDKYDYVREERAKEDSELYGGKSGTDLHPLLQKAGY